MGELLLYLFLEDEVLGAQLSYVRPDKRHETSMEEYLDEFLRVDDTISI